MKRRSGQTKQPIWRQRGIRDGGPILHQDGSVTFYSIRRSRWLERVHSVRDLDLDSLPVEYRDRIVRHLNQREGQKCEHGLM